MSARNIQHYDMIITGARRVLNAMLAGAARGAGADVRSGASLTRLRLDLASA